MPTRTKAEAREEMADMSRSWRPQRSETEASPGRVVSHPPATWHCLGWPVSGSTRSAQPIAVSWLAGQGWIWHRLIAEGWSGKGGLFLSRVRCEDGLEINAWHPGVVVAALIDARRVVMRLLRVVGLPAWQDDDFPSAEAAREEHREFVGAKCDRFAGQGLGSGPGSGD
jgi:hypothetical protein